MKEFFARHKALALAVTIIDLPIAAGVIAVAAVAVLLCLLAAGLVGMVEIIFAKLKPSVES